MATYDSAFERLMSDARQQLPQALENPQPGDLGRLSIETLIARTGDPRDDSSKGVVRLSGAGVLGHAADLDDVGQIATLWQRCVSAVGAALEGSRSARGRIAADVKLRTQLLLDASPAPGSVVLNVTPKESPLHEAFPDGQRSLVGAPRPLADRASEALLDLLQRASNPSPHELDDLSGRFQHFGPRVASTVRALASALSKAHIDLDAIWAEPAVATRSAKLSAGSAGWLKDFVSGRDLDAEDEVVVGTVRTVSDVEKWLIETANGMEQVNARSLDDAFVRATNVGDTVRLLVRVKATERPDGTTTRILTAVRALYEDEPTDY